MRKTLIVAFTLAVSTAYSQDIIVEDLPMQIQYVDGRAEFKQVIEVPGKKVDELYKAAIRWVTVVYKNPDAVITAKIEDELVKGQGFAPEGSIKLTALSFAALRYNFQIDIKEGKIRFSVIDMEVVANNGNSFPIEGYLYKSDGSERTGGQATNVKESSTILTNGILQSLEKNLLTGESKKDDW